MNALVIALVVAISSTVSPLLLSLLTSRQRQSEKREQWARDDELARRLQVANGKLDKIEKLVDGAMLQQKRTEFDGIQRELVMMRRLAGKSPTEDETTAITSTEAKLDTLAGEIDSRVQLEKEL